MKKELLASLVLCLSLSPLVSTNEVFAATTNKEAKEKVSITTEIGYEKVKDMLEQQKYDFEHNTPLAHPKESKLTDSDEGVLLYSALSKVDKQKFHEFTYDIDDVKTSEKNNKLIVEAYITRNFVFGVEKVTTSLGDNIKLEIPKTASEKPSSQSTNTSNLSLSEVKNSSNQLNVIPLNNSSNQLNVTQLNNSSSTLQYENDEGYSTDVKLDEFLKKYKQEVKKDDKEEVKSENKPVSMNFNAVNSNQLTVMPLSVKGYSGYAAMKYAEKYALKPNKNYKYYKDKDCTNFVSQALRAGRMPYFKEWKPYTDAWVNAGAFRSYILKAGGIKMKTVSDTYSNVKLGDVYHYDYHNKIGLRYADGWMDHTAIVTSRANMKLYVSYHSTNRLNVPREYVTSKEGGKRYVSSIRN
ncbi:amidase domain-containing protein [Bacillus licheniformis]|uniref:Amidase domain-containing protein n=2 Tax=Bacillus TaxID=1386 RepID=A0AA90ETH5_9BACI|nr:MULTISPECIES: amidase domain-containing protein [Bacillus]MCM3212039.1 amidase domain-containing protein [Bacillus licheniformis]MCM3287940.1 amidase domain-containing protein [Bacillus licheniformis]MCY7772735.1 amidase domain-containing protein [Bacillus licheniformis]MCY7956162.1 amidase domain-containing protein [Bacillus licheniformis]MCY8157671.1 amidase domain-containing protein [Bacillus licheniformis]